MSTVLCVSVAHTLTPNADVPYGVKQAFIPPDVLREPPGYRFHVAPQPHQLQPHVTSLGELQKLRARLVRSRSSLYQRRVYLENKNKGDFKTSIHHR